MNGRILLDTNIVIAMFANEAAIIDHMEKLDEVFIPCIVIGELSFGAQKSGRVSENLSQVNDFASNSEILGCDTETAFFYGQIKNSLRKKGMPLPENDIWIASIALQYDSILVTRDTHFDKIEKLKIEYW